MKKATNMVIASLIVYIVLFFVVSALVMVLWNNSLKKSFSEGSVKKIDYPTAMGLTLLFGLVFGSGPVIVNMKGDN